MFGIYTTHLTVRIAFEIVLLIRGTVLETKSLFML